MKKKATREYGGVKREKLWEVLYLLLLFVVMEEWLYISRLRNGWCRMRTAHLFCAWEHDADRKSELTSGCSICTILFIIRTIVKFSITPCCPVSWCAAADFWSEKTNVSRTSLFAHDACGTAVISSINPSQYAIVVWQISFPLALNLLICKSA